MSDQKYCRNCKHCNQEFTEWMCMKTASRDLVTGNVILDTCKFTRNDLTKCGTKADWFEPKE